MDLKAFYLRQSTAIADTVSDTNHIISMSYSEYHDYGDYHDTYHDYADYHDTYHDYADYRDTYQDYADSNGGSW